MNELRSVPVANFVLAGNAFPLGLGQIGTKKRTDFSD